MPRLAANISWLFTERPFPDRFAAAARAGFPAVEMMFPFDWPADALAAARAASGLPAVLLNLPGGADGRGTAALPGREAEFEAGLDRALGYAAALGVANIHALAGTVPPGEDRARCHDRYVANLAAAARRAEDAGLGLLIEPLNPRDAASYFLATLEQALAVVAEVGAPNLRVQADLYHLQIAGGDVLTRLAAALPRVGHVQLAGAPDRNEPDRGELAFGRVFELLDAAGYDGWVGCEYRPAAGTEAGLGWAAPWLSPARSPAD